MKIAASFRTRIASAGALLAMLTALPGCDPAADPDAAQATVRQPGTGNRQLEVALTIQVYDAFDNAERRTDLDTYFDLTVLRYTKPVADAEIALDTDSGRKALVGDDTGHYQGSHAGYHQAYRLAVTAGADSVQDVVVVGPDLHVLTQPDPKAAFTAGEPVTVAWQSESSADAVWVRWGNYDARDLPDTGTHTIPGDQVVANDAAGQRIEVIRETRMGLTGGAVGSEAIVRLRNRSLPIRVCEPSGCLDEGRQP